MGVLQGTSTAQSQQRRQKYTNNYNNYNNTRSKEQVGKNNNRSNPNTVQPYKYVLAGQCNTLATQFLRWCIHSRQKLPNWQASSTSSSRLDSPKLPPYCSWCHSVLQYCGPPCCQLLVVVQPPMLAAHDAVSSERHIPSNCIVTNLPCNHHSISDHNCTFCKKDSTSPKR